VCYFYAIFPIAENRGFVADKGCLSVYFYVFTGEMAVLPQKCPRICEDCFVPIRIKAQSLRVADEYIAYAEHFDLSAENTRQGRKRRKDGMILGQNSYKEKERTHMEKKPFTCKNPYS